MDKNIDVIIGLQYGDEAKGKITHRLAKNNYKGVFRFNGGGNAGHTIYHEGEKYVTHLIPCGVFYGKLSIIGNGCVLNVEAFFKELEYLKKNFDTSLVKIATNTHILTDAHKEEDSKDISIGTTRTGNGPCYRDKYNRKGIRAEQISELKPYLIQMEDLPSGDYLAEGAQAFGLDIDWGDYPYVTSSHCGIGSVLLNGFNHKQIRKVYGVMKAYSTYVGMKSFEPSDDVFKLIREKGKEYGATTGRPRQCNWLDLDLVKRAINMNGVDVIYMNKMDILREINIWNVIVQNKIVNLGTEDNFQNFVTEALGTVEFEYSPH